MTDPSDPASSWAGLNDGYGEVHLQDFLGTRTPGTTNLRTSGWERQLYVQIYFENIVPTYYMDFFWDGPPQTTQTFIWDNFTSFTPGSQVLVDSYGSVFEISSVNVPFLWLKKTSGIRSYGSFWKYNFIQ